MSYGLLTYKFPYDSRLGADIIDQLYAGNGHKMELIFAAYFLQYVFYINFLKHVSRWSFQTSDCSLIIKK